MSFLYCIFTSHFPVLLRGGGRKEGKTSLPSALGALAAHASCFWSLRGPLREAEAEVENCQEFLMQYWGYLPSPLFLFKCNFQVCRTPSFLMVPASLTMSVCCVIYIYKYFGVAFFFPISYNGFFFFTLSLDLKKNSFLRGGFKQHKFILLHFWWLEVWNQVYFCVCGKIDIT